MKYSLFLLSIIISLLYFGIQRSFAEQTIKDSDESQYLLTLASTSGTLKGDILTLNGVPLVVYFSDRPIRQSGHLSLNQFENLWSEGLDNFKQDPPNAELSIFNKNGDKHAIVILGAPLVNGETVSFKINLTHGKIPESFEHSTLFIDALGVIFPSDQN